LKTRFRRWRARGVRLSRRRRALIAAGLVVGVAWAAALMLRTPGVEPDQLVSDAGPSAPPCPTLLRVGDQEIRCTEEKVEAAAERVDLALLTPSFPPNCRVIVSDRRGNLVPLRVTRESTGLSGSIGPIKRSATPYTLRFISLDERIEKAEACGLWAAVSAQIIRPLPAPDAGAKPAEK
jgi:hypothetical protein